MLVTVTVVIHTDLPRLTLLLLQQATATSTKRPDNQAFTVYQQLHYAPLQGIGSGHRQLIAVTCLAEHA